MRIQATLPANRYAEGKLWVLGDDGIVAFGPVRCRGEADNTNAAKHDNVVEDPTRVGGDHPYGTYRVQAVIRDPQPGITYGPVFLRLGPVSGQAFEAMRNGRTGFGIHGGRLHADGRLRETYGCNRVDDTTATALGKLVREQLDLGKDVFYYCEETTS